tara:strand:+ start:786 stop:971 length:186 start_codon:yes stop_codon:yes gene_type:complete
MRCWKLEEIKIVHLCSSLMKDLLEALQNWFFELIEDAVGEKTMKRYREEMNKKNKSIEKDE